MDNTDNAASVALQALETALADARQRAAAAELPQEGLGVLKQGRWRGRRIVRAGSAWRLGALLLSDDQVFGTGTIFRAAHHVRRGYTAESARSRAQLQAEAHRGGFRDGEVVHLDWTTIDTVQLAEQQASGPLILLGNIPHVKWSRTGDPAPLAGYLDEQLNLQGA
ncbi:glutaminase [Microbacterium sp. YY-01]|uniref:glutaminase n=1 Tax=Microbacterium sp. YY-01 TaxID=3421634 RepID=UPI003D182DE3